MKITAIFAALFFTFAGLAMADDVTDSLDRARNLYEQGNFSKAVTELQFTVGLIQDRQLERFKEILPEPPSGWTGDKPEVNRGGGMGFAGGVTVARTYHSSNGQTVTIEAVTDSPLVSGLAMLLGNPMLLGNNRLVTVKGEKAVEEWDQGQGSGKLQIIIQNRMLITVSGTGLNSKGILYDFAKRLDFNKIKNLLQE